MAEALMIVAALMLALYGCVELIRRVVALILRPCPRRSGVLVLPLSGHHDDVEYLVRAMAARSRWSADLAESTLLLDAGMDEETLAMAESLCEKYGCVRLGKAEELPGLLLDDD